MFKEKVLTMKKIIALLLTMGMVISPLPVWAGEELSEEPLEEEIIAEITGDRALPEEYADGDASFKTAGGYFESIYAELQGVTKDQIAGVSWSGKASGSLSETDMEYLVRTQEGGVVRIDIPGLEAGTYDLAVLIGDVNLVKKNIEVMAYDRSGYAHYQHTEGVGAYTDKGTLKEKALVVYVTDDNKNTVEVDFDGSKYTGIGNILKSTDLMKALSEKQTALDVRFIGIVSDSGLYKTALYDESADPLIDGLDKYKLNSTNGHSANISGAKNLTLEGIGPGATIDGWGFSYNADGKRITKNFEVRNLRFINTPEDAIGMTGKSLNDYPVERCWIHNNSFYRPILKECSDHDDEKGWDKFEGDGSIDLSTGKYLTVAYNFFDDCHKTSLLGGGESKFQYHITYHHNHWYRCGSRIPMVRNADVHSYNNVIEYQSNTGMNARYNSFIFSEYNLFYMCKNPQAAKISEGGAILSSHDSLAGVVYGSDYKYSDVVVSDDKTTQVTTGCIQDDFLTNSAVSYIPGGTYALDTDLTDVRKKVEAYAGPIKETVISPTQVMASDYSLIKGGRAVNASEVVDITDDAYSVSNTATNSSEGFAFRIFCDSTLTVSYDEDTGVLINESGENLLKGNGSTELSAGTYMIQNSDFLEGNYRAGPKTQQTGGESQPPTIQPVKIASLNVTAKAGVKKKYTMSLDYNYKGSPARFETDVTEGTIIENAGGVLALASGFARDGYKLVGFYLDPGLAQPAEYPITVSEPFGFYAKWEKLPDETEPLPPSEPEPAKEEHPDELKSPGTGLIGNTDPVTVEGSDQPLSISFNRAVYYSGKKLTKAAALEMVKVNLDSRWAPYISIKSVKQKNTVNAFIKDNENYAAAQAKNKIPRLTVSVAINKDGKAFKKQDKEQGRLLAAYVKNVNKALKKTPVYFDINPLPLRLVTINAKTYKKAAGKLVTVKAVGSLLKGGKLTTIKNGKDFTVVENTFDEAGRVMQITGKGNYTGAGVLHIIKVK